ncbi:hypothetical protein SLE2022_137490 [Rubroshorea leprosula]
MKKLLIICCSPVRNCGKSGLYAMISFVENMKKLLIICCSPVRNRGKYGLYAMIGFVENMKKLLIMVSYEESWKVWSLSYDWFCGKYEEIIDHLLFSCEESRNVWSHVFKTDVVHVDVGHHTV